MKTRLLSPFLFLTGLVLLVSLACSTLTTIQPTNPPPVATQVVQPTNPPPVATQTVRPTSIPQPSFTPQPRSGDLLYSTVFNDLGSWTAYPKEDLSDYTLEGRAEGLYFVIPSDNDFLFMYYDDSANYTDVRLEADVELTGGTNYVYFYLICRSTVDEEYYFILDAGGFWQIAKYVNQQYTRLADGGGTAIHVAKAENHMTAICEGSTLTFLINGVELGSVEDHSLASGMVGVALRTFDYPRAEGFIHSLEVYLP